MKVSSNGFPIELKKIGRIKAYRNFLKKRKVKLNLLKSIRNLRFLPATDKSSYISHYKRQDLFLNGKIPPMIYASSGSSGQPTFWFRGDEQERVGGEIHRLILDKIFNIKKHEKTLVVICFSMGVWVAGNYTLASFREVSRRGYNLSVISPGTEREDIFNILKNLAPEFENLILAGYPPFIMDIISDSIKMEIKFKNKKVKIITAGDKFSEKWRADLLHLLKINDRHNNSLVSIYGSADVGILGHETPLTILLRKEALSNEGLWQELFGEVTGDPPAIVQYHPSEIKFEAIQGELVLTAKTALPLVRYNIHDTGKILTLNNLKTILKKHHLINRASKFGLDYWKLPVLILTGRTDVAVTFYALNIYPENISSSIADPRISKFLSGNFSTFNKTYNKSKTQKLYIKLELANTKVSENKIERLVTKVVVENLSKLNIEYRKLCSVIGKKAKPVIIFTKPNETNLAANKERKVLYIRGKKPRMVLASN